MNHSICVISKRLVLEFNIVISGQFHTLAMFPFVHLFFLRLLPPPLTDEVKEQKRILVIFLSTTQYEPVEYVDTLQTQPAGRRKKKMQSWKQLEVKIETSIEQAGF